MDFSDLISWKLFGYGRATIRVQFLLKGAFEKSSGVQDQKILTIKHMKRNSRVRRYQNMFWTKIVKQNNYCLYFFLFLARIQNLTYMSMQSSFSKHWKFGSQTICFASKGLYRKSFIWEIFSDLIRNFLGFVIISKIFT